MFIAGARRVLFCLGSALVFSGVVGCGPRPLSLQNKGSDTMLEVGQAWAEEYSDVSVEVSGGGSGTGIAALINGTVDIANASRQIKPKEAEAAKKSTGKDPVEYIVGYDALAVYAHKDSPMAEISLAQLMGMYGKDGTVEKWSQMDAEWDGCESDEIVRVSRQNNSGTYVYFREAVLGKEGEYRLGTLDQSGSRDVVELVSNTPCAIGYSGMGYKTDGVKFIKVKAEDGAPAVEPSVESVNDKSYPIARPLYMYTPGPADGAAKAYLDWIMSAAGQKILQDKGYVPLPKESWTSK